MSDERDVVRLRVAAPPDPGPSHEELVSAATVQVLEDLLAAARSGQVLEVAAIAWGSDQASPRFYCSIGDKLRALGAVDAVGKLVFRDWVE